MNSSQTNRKIQNYYPTGMCYEEEELVAVREAAHIIR